MGRSTCLCALGWGGGGPSDVAAYLKQLSSSRLDARIATNKDKWRLLGTRPDASTKSIAKGVCVCAYPEVRSKPALHLALEIALVARAAVVQPVMRVPAGGPGVLERRRFAALDAYKRHACIDCLGTGNGWGRGGAIAAGRAAGASAGRCGHSRSGGRSRRSHVGNHLREGDRAWDNDNGARKGLCHKLPKAPPAPRFEMASSTTCSNLTAVRAERGQNEAGPMPRSQEPCLPGRRQGSFRHAHALGKKSHRPETSLETLWAKGCASHGSRRACARQASRQAIPWFGESRASTTARDGTIPNPKARTRHHPQACGMSIFCEKHP